MRTTRISIMVWIICCTAICLGWLVSNAQAQATTDLLAIYILAFDNEANSPSNLEPQYRPVVSGLIQATQNSNAVVAALVDLNDKDDPAQYDHILIIKDGVVAHTIFAQPIASGTLSTTTSYEYNVTDSETIGGFIKWARTQFSATQTTFSFVGHGTFAPPSATPPVFEQSNPISWTTPANAPLPLPHTIGANPDHTDVNTTFAGGNARLITPQALRHALEIGTDNGTNPIDVADLVHCFAASVEEFYELSNPGGTPYAAAMLGSANYAYFAPEMLGAGVAAWGSTTGDPAEMATTLLHTYDQILAAADASDGDPTTVEQPRSLVVVESAALSDLKAAIDQTVEKLLTDSADIVADLQFAQQQAGLYYDSSCEADFALNPADALVDVGALGAYLDAIADWSPHAPHPSIEQAARAAVITQTVANGTPWFSNSSAVWSFDGYGMMGLSIYAELNGAEIAPNQFALTWQHASYTTDADEPLLFLEPETTSTTWRDLITAYWDARIAAGATVTTSACLPSFPFVPEEAEVSAENILLPRPEMVQDGASVRFGGTVSTDSTVTNPLVQFIVIDAAENIVFSTTIATGNLDAGVHYVESDEAWSVNTSPFNVVMSVDPDDHITQDDPDNNVVVSAEYHSLGDTPFTLNADTMTIEKSVYDRSISLILQSSVYPVPTVYCSLYHFSETPSPWTLLPILLTTNQLEPLTEEFTITTCELPPDAPAGVYGLQIWGVLATGEASLPVQLRLNYMPPNQELGAGERDYFVYRPDLDNSELILELTGNADLLLWEPGANYAARRLTSPATLDSLVDGDYVISVHAPTEATTYTLQLDSRPPNLAEAMPEPTGTAAAPFVATPTPVATPDAAPENPNNGGMEDSTGSEDTVFNFITENGDFVSEIRPNFELPQPACTNCTVTVPTAIQTQTQASDTGQTSTGTLILFILCTLGMVWHLVTTQKKGKHKQH